VLDTGHILNKNQSIRNESEAADYILETVERLGEYKSLIKALHLCRSLSGEYVLQSRKIDEPFKSAENFWDRLRIAAQHVRHIDQHEPFEEPFIAKLFDRISPEFTVFEFWFNDMEDWLKKINKQKKALGLRCDSL
jgi:hypothetical protein